MKKDQKVLKNSSKKKRKLDEAPGDGEPDKKLKLSTISSIKWDLRSILSDPETALEPLKTFLTLNSPRRISVQDDDDAKDEKERVGGDDDDDDGKGAAELFGDACDSYIEESPEFVHLFTLLDKWSKKNSELKVALELFDALLLRLLTRRRRRGDDDEREDGDEEDKGDDDDDDALRFALLFATATKRFLQEQTQILYKLMDNRNNATQIKAALKTLTTIAASGPSGVRLILDHVDLTHPNFPTLLNRRDKRDEKDVRLGFILLVVGMLVNGDGRSTERLLQTKSFVQGFFSGLLHDSSSTIFLFLTVMRERVLENPAVSKSRKVKVFHEKTLKDLSSLLRWRPGILAAPNKKWTKEAKKKAREREAEAAKEEKEGDVVDEETRKVREAAAAFLRLLLTDAKLGIAFQIDDLADGSPLLRRRRRRVPKFCSTADENPNHLITAFLKALRRPFSNGLNGRLALDILVSCPDQIFHFLHFHAHVFAPRPTDLWKSAVQFLVDLLETLPVAAAVDGGRFDDVDGLVDSCVPRQLFAGVHSVMTVGLKHPEVGVVSESLRLLGAVLGRSNRAIAAGSVAEKEAFSRLVAKILPPPSDLVASGFFASGNLALKASEDLSGTLACLGHLIRALTAYSELAPQALVEDDCGDLYRVFTVTAFLCDSASTRRGGEATESVVAKEEAPLKPGDREKREEQAGGEEVEEMKEVVEEEEEKPQPLLSMDLQPEEAEPIDPVHRQFKDLFVDLLRLFSVCGSLLPEMIKATSATSDKAAEERSILNQFLMSLRGNFSPESEADDVRQFLVKALTSQSCLKAAAVEIGIWFRHLSRFDGDANEAMAIVDFLEESLCRVVAHPYPWMDQVMDFQAEAEMQDVEDPNWDSATESASVASADSVIDAVLSLEPFDEGNLDRDVLSSTVDDVVEDDQVAPWNDSAWNSDEMFVDTSLALPFSPILTAAFAELKRAKTDHRPVLVDYLLKVLYDLLHTQADGRALSSLLRKQTLEGHIPPDAHILSLVQALHPQVASPRKTLDKFANAVEELLLSSGAQNNLDFDELRISGVDSLLRFAFQTVHYVAHLVDRASLKSTKGHGLDSCDDRLELAVNWKVKLPRLFKILHHCLDGLAAASRSSLRDKEAELELLNARIYGQPSILRWFLRLPDRASPTVETEDSIAYEVTVGVSKCVPKTTLLSGDAASPSDVLSRVVPALITYYADDAVFPSKLFKEALNVVFDNFATRVSRSDLAKICRLLFTHPTSNFLLTIRGEAETVTKLSLLGKKSMHAVETLFGGNGYDSRPHHTFVSALGDLFVSLTAPEDKERVADALRLLLDKRPSFGIFVGAATVKELIKDAGSQKLVTTILPFCSDEWKKEFEEIFVAVLKRASVDFSPWRWKALEVYFGAHHRGDDDEDWLADAVLGRLLTPKADDVDFAESGRLVARVVSRGDPESMYRLCGQLVVSFDESVDESRLSRQLEFFSVVASGECERLSPVELIAKCLEFLLKLVSCGEKRSAFVGTMLRNCNLLLARLKNDADDWSKIRPLIVPLWSKLVKRSLKSFFKAASALEFVRHLVHFVTREDGTRDSVGSLAVQPSRLFAMIVSHSEFIQVLLNPSDEAAKSALVALVVDVLPHAPDEDFVDESSTNLRKAFMSAYSATLSPADQNIFTILAKFDSLLSTPSKPSLWGKASLERQSMQGREDSLWKSEVTMESVLNALDAEIMENTVRNFPLYRMLDPLRQMKYAARDEKKASASSHFSEMYDPGFLLPLLLEFLSPSQLFNVKKFVQRRCLAFIFAATSSHFESVRLVAYAALGRFQRHLEGSRFAERGLFRRCLILLKNSIEKPGARIPNVVSAFFARASLILLSPEDDMYCDVCNFILLKPVMDLNNVPEYYRLFNSSNPLKCGKDRLWITELMRDGLVEKWDYIIFEKRQAIRTIETLLLSELSGESVKLTTTSLETLREAAQIPRACFELVVNHNFLSALTILSERLKSNKTATGILAQIFVGVWRTVESRASKSETRLDSIASAYCRAVLSCLPNFLGCDDDDAEVVKSLSLSLHDALASIHDRRTKESVMSNSAEPLRALIEHGLHHVSTRDEIDDEFVDAILDIVVNEADFPLRANRADFLKLACALFAKSRRSEKQWLRASGGMQTSSTERFLSWLERDVLKADDGYEDSDGEVNGLLMKDADEMFDYFLVTYEKILVEGSENSWILSKLKSSCLRILSKLAACERRRDAHDLRDLLMGLSQV